MSQFIDSHRIAMNSISNNLLLNILSNISKFNRRDFYNSQLLTSFLEDLAHYKQTRKSENLNRVLEELPACCRTDQLRIIEAWKLLLTSERLYEDALQIEVFRRGDKPSRYKLQVPWITKSQEGNLHKLEKCETTRSKKPNTKKFKIKFPFFEVLKGESSRKAKNYSFEEKVLRVGESMEVHLAKHFDTFITSCKKYGLVSIEDGASAQQVTVANKKFNNTLWLLQRKIHVVFDSLAEEISNLEYEEAQRSVHSDTNMSQLLDDWSVSKLIVSTFIDSLQDICTSLKSSPTFQQSFANLRLSFEVLHGSCDKLDAHILHETEMNKLLIDRISTMIVQLQMESPANRFGHVVSKLKDCLNMFRSRCKVKSIEYDFVITEGDVKRSKDNEVMRRRINMNMRKKKKNKMNFSLECLSDDGEGMMYCIGIRRSL